MASRSRAGCSFLGAVEKRLMQWQGSFVWACAHGCPGIFCRAVPPAHTCFSVGSLYIFAQALGLFWLFLVSLLASMCVRIVTAAVEMPASNTAAVYGKQPLRAVALGYVYYSIIRIFMLFARSMWTVAWETYHDFPTLRRMLLGAKGAPGEASKQSPKGSPRTTPVARGGKDSKEPSGKEAPNGASQRRQEVDQTGTMQRRQARRRIVLISPLLVLAIVNSTLLLGQSFCDGRTEGICSDSVPIFQPTAHLNRALRFVLFLALVQWFQAWTGLFSSWTQAVSSGKGALPRFVSFFLLLVLMPCSTLRLAAWLLQPAGSGVVRRTLGGLVPHHTADSALVTAWSWWSLLAVYVVMDPQLLGLSGFTLRSVSQDARWKHLTMLFKYTLFFWLAVHFLRGCVAHGFAVAQTDLITISFLYPLLLCFIWTATFVAVALSGAFSRMFWPVLGSLVMLPVVFLLARLLCNWVDRGSHPLLIALTWVHLCRAAFRMARYGGLWLKSDQLPSGEAAYPSIKFALNPDSHKVLKTTYFVERRLGRMAVRVLLLICASFLAILTSCVLLGGLQQRSGLFLEDLVWWQAAKDKKSVKIVNAGASVLTLGAKGVSVVEDGADALPTAVLASNATRRYAVCGHTWHGLQLVDYAFLALTAYISPSEKNAIPELLQHLFPQMDVSIRALHREELQRRWLEFQIRRCEPQNAYWPSWQDGSCRNLTVISVSGTDISRIADYAENLRMWTEPVSLGILATVFPTIRIWPRDSASLVIRTIHDILGGLGLADNQWHYSEILEHVRSLPRDQEVVITGHSLGGGIALVVGALTDRQAVAIQPPGMYHSLAKHEAQQRSFSGGQALHQRSVSLVFEGDWIQNFDGHGGLVQTMLCDQTQKSIAVGCHLLEGAICHLLRHCGDDAGRFSACRHDYQPGNTAWSIVQFVWEFLIASFQSSYFHSDFQPTLVAGLGVSLVVVLRHGAPPMLRSVGLVSG